MLRATEFCLICAIIVAVAQNKLRVSQLQAVGPGVIAENILQRFSSPQLPLNYVPQVLQTYHVPLSTTLCRASHCGYSCFINDFSSTQVQTVVVAAFQSPSTTFALPHCVLGCSSFSGSSWFCSCPQYDISHAM